MKCCGFGCSLDREVAVTTDVNKRDCFSTGENSYGASLETLAGGVSAIQSTTVDCVWSCNGKITCFMRTGACVYMRVGPCLADEAVLFFMMLHRTGQKSSYRPGDLGVDIVLWGRLTPRVPTPIDLGCDWNGLGFAKASLKVPTDASKDLLG